MKNNSVLLTVAFVLCSSSLAFAVGNADDPNLPITSGPVIPTGPSDGTSYGTSLGDVVHGVRAFGANLTAVVQIAGDIGPGNAGSNSGSPVHFSNSRNEVGLALTFGGSAGPHLKSGTIKRLQNHLSAQEAIPGRRFVASPKAEAILRQADMERNAQVKERILNASAQSQQLPHDSRPESWRVVWTPESAQ